METSMPPVFGKEKEAVAHGIGRCSPNTSIGFFAGDELEAPVEMYAAVITVSDKGYAGKREDISGPMVAKSLREMGAEVLEQLIVPDEVDHIVSELTRLADRGDVDVVLTTGGTGFAPRDRTPEATLQVIDRVAPGVAEILRLEGYKMTPLAVVSRGVAGLRGQCLIINLPGSTKAVRDGMQTLRKILPHAIQMARGEDLEHGDDAHAH
jgi:molybdenum cofactor synthesis domain-containing protein